VGSDICIRDRCRTECIADDLKDVAVVQFNWLMQDGVMAHERVGHRVGKLLPQLRAALDVAEEESDRAAGRKRQAYLSGWCLDVRCRWTALYSFADVLLIICDNDSQFGAEFERVAKTSGNALIHTPYQAPLAHTICERFAAQGRSSVVSVRRECLNHSLVLAVRHLMCILKDDVSDFNRART